jgi:hypothetical protein
LLVFPPPTGGAPTSLSRQCRASDLARRGPGAAGAAQQPEEAVRVAHPRRPSLRRLRRQLPRLSLRQRPQPRLRTLAQTCPPEERRQTSRGRPAGGRHPRATTTPACAALPEPARCRDAQPLRRDRGACPLLARLAYAGAPP